MMFRRVDCVIGILSLCFIQTCGVYTFSGSTLPSHLKTVDIPLFVNQSLEPTVADEITQQLNREVLTSNLLRVIAENGDATISGKIVSYSNTPYTFGASAARQVDVAQYAVRIAVDVEFLDNKKDEPLYRGTVTGEGIYDFQSQQELDGRATAIKDVVRKILQNSIQSW